MWGNRQGWILAVVLLLMIGGVTYVLAASARLTPQTDFSRQGDARALIHLPVEPATIFAAGQLGDAGPVYRALAQKVASRADELTAQARQYEKPLPAEFTAMVQPLVDVMELREARIFADAPELVVHYASQSPQLDALYAVGLVSARLSRDQAPSDPAGALVHAQATFALGCKLYRERITYDELDKGLALMDTACQVMIQQAEPRRQEQLWAFATALRGYRGKVQEIQRIIISPDESLVARHAGDVFALATDPTIDPTWRVESILKVGRYRYQAYRAGDQRKAPVLLDQLAADPNLAIRVAVLTAQRLTLEEFHRIGG